MVQEAETQQSLFGTLQSRRRGQKAGGSQLQPGCLWEHSHATSSSVTETQSSVPRFAQSKTLLSAPQLKAACLSTFSALDGKISEIYTFPVGSSQLPMSIMLLKFDYKRHENDAFQMACRLPCCTLILILNKIGEDKSLQVCANNQVAWESGSLPPLSFARLRSSHSSFSRRPEPAFFHAEWTA